MKPPHLSYSPLHPDESSSGTYSGGEAVEKDLTEDQCIELRGLLSEIQSKSELHVDTRSMGTGSFQLTRPDGKEHFILAPGAELDSFTGMLEKLRK